MANTAAECGANKQNFCSTIGQTVELNFGTLKTESCIKNNEIIQDSLPKEIKNFLERIHNYGKLIENESNRKPTQQAINNIGDTMIDITANWYNKIIDALQYSDEEKVVQEESSSTETAAVVEETPVADNTEAAEAQVVDGIENPAPATESSEVQATSEFSSGDEMTPIVNGTPIEAVVEGTPINKKKKVNKA